MKAPKESYKLIPPKSVKVVSSQIFPLEAVFITKTPTGAITVAAFSAVKSNTAFFPRHVSGRLSAYNITFLIVAVFPMLVANNGEATALAGLSTSPTPSK